MQDTAGAAAATDFAAATSTAVVCSHNLLLPLLRCHYCQCSGGGDVLTVDVNTLDAKHVLQFNSNRDGLIGTSALTLAQDGESNCCCCC